MVVPLINIVVRGRPSSPARNNKNKNNVTGNSSTVVIVDHENAFCFDRVDFSSDPFHRQQNFLVVATRMHLNQVLAPLFALPPSSLIPRPTAATIGTACTGNIRQHSRAWSTASSTSSYSSYGGSYRHAGSLSPGSNTATTVTVTATCTEYSSENLSGADHIFLLRQFDSAAALVAALGTRSSGATLVLTVRRGPLQYTLVDFAPDVPIVVLRRIHAQILAGHSRITGFVNLKQRSDTLNTITALRNMFPHTATPVSPSIVIDSNTCSSNGGSSATADIMSGSEDEQWHNESTDTSIDSVMLKSPTPLSKNTDYETTISLLQAALRETQSTLQRTQAELQRKTAELEECQTGYIELAEMAGAVLLDPQPAVVSSTHTQNAMSSVQEVTLMHNFTSKKASTSPVSNNAINSTTPSPLNLQPQSWSSTPFKTNITTTITNPANTPNNLNDLVKDNDFCGAGADFEVPCRCCAAQADDLSRLEQILATRDLEIRGLRAEHVYAHRETQYLIRQYNRATKEAGLLRQQLDELKAYKLSSLSTALPSI